MYLSRRWLRGVFVIMHGSSSCFGEAKPALKAARRFRDNKGAFLCTYIRDTTAPAYVKYMYQKTGLDGCGATDRNLTEE